MLIEKMKKREQKSWKNLMQATIEKQFHKNATEI